MFAHLAVPWPPISSAIAAVAANSAPTAPTPASCTCFWLPQMAMVLEMLQKDVESIK